MTSISRLSEEEAAIVAAVRSWVDNEVRPVVADLEKADEYPEKLIEQMKEMGVFGLTIPTEYGGSGASAQCYAAVTEEISRGWMSLAGAFGGHSVVSHLLLKFGRDDQKAELLPPMASGSLRATMALTEPGGGSDLQAMRTVATRTDEGYVINGAKTWITNAQKSELVALLCKTDPHADPPHKGISIVLVPKGPGLTVSPGLGKLGYKGVESCELQFADMRVPANTLLGSAEGEGFAQMMAGLEIGRIQVAARAVGVARAAYEEALSYSQVRESFGKPIWRHQSIGNYLADMATKIEAARLLTLNAAACYEEGGRCDLEAGMAKLFASEIGMEVALNAMRIHGSYGYSTEYDIERYFRDAPLMIVGEGTNEIQRNIIVRQLVKRSHGG